MEDWVTIDEEVIDEMPCVCSEGMQYKVRLVEMDLINNKRRNRILVKIECPNPGCSSNLK
ncbi:hypothetical protein PB01_08235 [Psychrobacillus glaciei]|uniref:Uncharacterized protein n=1 Tax=Psychrobacillus glaciei TaxID=2283160 RepID=A0A5J6SLM6_9BACI|nr:hypothetical protein [Psychrobacillus glaciei]QFF98821.1 hypothetical protein PB01_08235 [Psychrobacillus glaciei]